MTATHCYFDRLFQHAAIKILPGEYHVTRSQLLVTVLGSCVAACLRDPGTGIAGMNHFLLPGADDDPANPASASARYGAFAMETLIQQMVCAGARRERLVAKVFGGGAVLPHVGSANVGERNAAFVLDFLARERIPLHARDLLGPYPRKIYFFPDSGHARIRVMRGGSSLPLLHRETRYAQRLDTPADDPAADFF
ncbi:chemoreceptor glutamine deamidase CheD [Thauera aromatica]|uniref:chemoreceptor glutamine deamidase CheD n=1 Tax=Thauera aromatica TaxID=59405 RepID=UPI001FFDB3F8|nr:chemoreceptor glutamine deamidase CheD [Thauera aromatica]MCK2087099.1 chemoreceptor glutamine deamidase CheD [Thauera aromatica]